MNRRNMSFYFSYHCYQIDSLIKNEVINSNNLIDGNSPIELNKLYDREKYHCTMIHSNIDSEEIPRIELPNIKANIKNVALWHDKDKYFLVAQLENDLLTLLYKQLKNKLNIANCFTNDREFKPHITLQKSKQVEDLYTPEKFHFLINKEVELEKFHLVNKKNK